MERRDVTGLDTLVDVGRFVRSPAADVWMADRPLPEVMHCSDRTVLSDSMNRP